MGYTKTDWTTATITADNFNKLQEQYAEAVADAIGIRAEGTAELRAEVVTSFPAHQTGRIIFHSGLKRFFYSTGAEWLVDPREAFYGDAQNGVFSSTGNITFSNSLGATVIRNYRDFTLNPGHTITTERGCRCLVIRSWGDITINGIIDLDKKGGFGDRYISIGGVQYDLLGGLGGNGGGHDPGIGGAEDSGIRSAGGMRGGGGRGGWVSSGRVARSRSVHIHAWCSPIQACYAKRPRSNPCPNQLPGISNGDFKRGGEDRHCCLLLLSAAAAAACMPLPRTHMQQLLALLRAHVGEGIVEHEADGC